MAALSLHPMQGVTVGTTSRWGGSDISLFRPVGLPEEIAHLPVPYRQALRTLPAQVAHFYGQEIKAHGPEILAERAGMANHELDPELLERGRLDLLALSLIDARFREVLAGQYLEHDYFISSESPSYYYFYFRGDDLSGNPADVYLRTIGLLPAIHDIKGVVLDLRGYGHGFEHDFGRVQQLLDAGFAVFTFDRIDHGLSSRWDPTKAHLRSAALYIIHTLQFMGLVESIQKTDPRLKDKPRFALASSQGGTLLAAAIKERGARHGLQRVVFDSPRWKGGSKYPPLLRDGILPVAHSFPRLAMQVPFLFKRPSPPEKAGPMSDGRFDYCQRYYESGAGLERHSLPNFDFSAGDRRLREWLLGLRDEAIVSFPSFMLCAFPEDVEVDVKTNLRIAAHLAKSGNAVRLTQVHSPSSAEEPGFMKDVVDFLLGQPLRETAGPTIFASPAAIRKFQATGPATSS